MTEKKSVFWKIRNNSDIKLSLESLVDNRLYLRVLLEDDSDFLKYLKTNTEYVCISYNSNWQNDPHCGFGWFEYDKDYINHLISKGYIFKGEINLRKDKLKKINARFR